MEQILYDSSISEGYNNTRTADPFIAKTLYQSIYSGHHGAYMDIGCGTGNYTIALAEKGFTMYGIDPAKKMLDTAKGRNSDINWVLANAGSIPMGNNFFDGIVGTLTLHHWENHTDSFKELYRVMKPGGKAAFFTSDPKQMEGYWLNHYFPKMMADATKQMPFAETIENAAQQAGFEVLAREEYNVTDDLKDNFLYAGKNRPHLYFDEDIRHGISAFAALSNAEEVENGLKELKNDIESGRFPEIKLKYDNSIGDYFFLKMKKN